VGTVLKGDAVEIRNFQEFILALVGYWTDLGCIWSQPYDSFMGAGTFHPHTFLKGVGPEPWRAVYVQPCRRPVDGRYGKSTYRFQHYYQLQVLLKPAPANIVDLFLKSLECVGIDLRANDVSLLEDDWKGPTLGAWGLGWEVRANGQEVTQFTYFQQLGGLDVDVICGEITYGLERLYMYAKGLTSALDIPYNDHFTYGDVFLQNEFEFSHFNFKEAEVSELYRHFDLCERTVSDLISKNLVIPAYDYVLQASHAFNLLDARGAISVSERQRYIGRVRDCAKQCALLYSEARAKLGFPMLNRLSADPRGELQSGGVQKLPAQDILQVLTEKMYASDPSNQKEQGRDLLLEFGVEEMPPSFQATALSQLNEKISAFISQRKEKFKDDPVFLKALEKCACFVGVSSRRIALQVKQLPCYEPAQKFEVWGPAERIAKGADGALSKAGEGFCKKNGIDPAQAIFKVKSDGVFLFAEKNEPGSDLAALLMGEAKAWIENLPAPLKMRWLPAEISPPFIRPVRWILALIDDAIYPLEAFGLKANRLSSGQRIQSPQYFAVRSSSEYFEKLQSLGVEPSWTQRRAGILEKAASLAASKGGRIRADSDLVDKLAGLSESPHVFLGHIAEKYMSLPQELIVSVLKEHMNYLSVEDHSGALLPYYIGVAGYECEDLNAMLNGTSTVVSGRLDDGAFYFETDLATPVVELRERLKAQLFQAGLGTIWDKTERIAKISTGLLGTALQNADSIKKVAAVLNAEGSSNGAGKSQFVFASENVQKIYDAASLAAQFCKADLKSGCVQEFPDEMQGRMGEILVNHQRPFEEISPWVGKAVGEHYLPTSASSELPRSFIGNVVALSDKLDTLVMLLNSGEDVKGNKDPFGLRRAALGILRILGMEGKETLLDLSLAQAISIALKCLEDSQVKVQPNTQERILAFVEGRLRAAWREEFDPGAVEAVLSRKLELSLPQARRFVVAVSDALRREGQGSFRNSLNPYRRCRNLTLQIPETVVLKGVRPEIFNHDAERMLYERLQFVEKCCTELVGQGKFEEMLSMLASLGEPLAAFFEGVMVNDTDESLRNNRLALLMRIRNTYEAVADFSQVQVQ
jgi:glycyl-tRNA synthetase